ncbi:histidine kinase [Shewanella xiamenensis]|uniref:FimV/HubP family polar landmark protein n=1 Tax=Shewanella xiamenensis TaxID=332186 RepID=UPI001186AC32|nr:FimV/HubP family polar landmark protein [Shewanella xiamenensis]TVL23669.1 histidine kinase [Shewanella xiamenensis]TVL24233.1 histidine kinase [Shewanella xiamenensis]TVL26669.1 histidine kinase [Shewanella xiamenensis]TVL37741.1 histidine kinase [Shewanella xiamenensis]TVP05200.1 histidine kinase [Shewanella xiamenensis]
MTKIAKSLGLFALVCSAVQAQVSHVSINSRMFELGAYPKMRVNVISDSQDMTRLEFALHQSTGEEKLMVEQLNRFLVLLTGVEDVTDPKARLLVREYRVDRWYEVKNLPLFDNTSSATSSVSQAKTAVVKSSKAAKAETSQLAASSAKSDKTTVKSTKVVQEVNLVTAEADVAPVIVAAVTANVAAPRASGFTFPEDKPDAKASSASSLSTEPSIAKPSTEPSAAQVSSANADMAKADKSINGIDVSEAKTAEVTKIASSTNANATSSGECMLDYHNETLWRIANRYALEWQVSVYGAMLAIHDANPKAFAKNRINALKKDATLTCPSAEILARYPNAQAAKASFEDREAGQ